jgi:hypothetical protein
METLTTILLFSALAAMLYAASRNERAARIDEAVRRCRDEDLRKMLFHR